MRLGFASGLLQILLQAIANRGQLRLIERPHADERFVNEQLRVVVIDPVLLRPAPHLPFPTRGDFGEDVDASAHVLAPFRVVC